MLLGVMVIMLLTSSVDMMLACSFTIGLLTSQRYTVGYIYLVEMMPESHQTMIVMCWAMWEACIGISAPLYFWKISNNWIGLFYAGFCSCIISILATILLPESPRLLIELDRLEEAKYSLQRMATYNRKTLHWDPSEFDEHSNHEQS